MRSLFMVAIWLFWMVFSCAGADAQKAAEEARQSLRKQGFKTDLSEFNFLTDPETANRTAALTNNVRARPPQLLQPAGRDAALVAWNKRLSSKRRVTSFCRQSRI